MSKPFAVLTGASKGIGFAAAEWLAKKGYDLLLCSRNTDEAVKKLSEYDVSVEGLNGSIGEVATIQQIQKIVLKKQKVDALLLNHGGPPVKPFMSVSDEEWQQYIPIMLTGPLALLRALVPFMQQQKSGRVVAITSFTVKNPYQGIVLSNSLRAALVNALKTAAIELAPDGILINMVAPGYIATQRVVNFNTSYAQQEGVSIEEINQRTLQTIPLKKFGAPEDVGRFVSFLLSEENQYITGQNIQIDGGLIIAN